MAVADSYSTPEGTAKVVAAPGVLGNDTDADSDPLTAVLVSDVSHGTLSLAASGGFTYTPTGGYSGPDSFTYKANDGTADSNTVTVSLTVTAASSNTALQLNGSSQYATLGTASDLRSATFTVEMWVKRTGAGVGTSTGTGGLANAIPLIAKGRAEAETAAADINYFLGIDASTGNLVADFEEGQGGSTPSANHPITGTKAISADNTWHHVAATYDGSTWHLYLDGTDAGSLSVGKPANAATNVLTSIGSALTTTGTAAGFFAGSIDEVRIWNSARTLTQIQASKDTEITTPQSGLLGVWNLNEGSGSSLADNSGNNTTGAAVGSPTWVTGFVPPAGNGAPDAPTLNAPAERRQRGRPLADVEHRGLRPRLGSADRHLLRPAARERQLHPDRPAHGRLLRRQRHRELVGPRRRPDVRVVRDRQRRHRHHHRPDLDLPHHRRPATPSSSASATSPRARTRTTRTPAAVIQGVDGNVFTVGDNVYPNGDPADYTNCYAPTWGIPSILSRTRPVPGNHDWGAGVNDNLDGYFGYFGAAATDANGKSYYSYDIPSSNWHVVNLDSECEDVPGGCTAGSAARALAEGRPRRQQQQERHRHLAQAALQLRCERNLTDVQPFVNDLYAAGADIRARRPRPHVRADRAENSARGYRRPDPAHGIRYITIGTGGDSHQGFGTPIAGKRGAGSETRTASSS